MALSIGRRSARAMRLDLDWEAALFWAYLVLLLWAPIPLGSNRAWAWATLEVGTFLVLAAWIAAWALHAANLEAPIRRSSPAWILLGAWLLLQISYIVPLPPGLVELISPQAARAQSLASDIGIARSTMTLSVEPYASYLSLLKSFAYVAIFFLTIVLVNRRSRVLILAQVLVYAAVIHAIYAVLMHLADFNVEFFGTLIPHGEQASGTYANRNHFAGFLEMMLAMGIGLLIAGLSDRHADTWKKFVRHTIDWILSPKMFLRLSLCVLVIALTTTHSRMGNTSFFSSLLIAGVIGIVLSRHATRNTIILLVSLIVIDLFIVGSWFGVEKLAQRLEQTTTEDVRVREEPAAYSLDLIKDYPIFGAGPGTFYVAFPRYRNENVVNFYEYAHNDYAQFSSESGIFGLAIIGTFVAMSLGAGLLAQWRRRDPLMRGMAFACVMGITSILIHSWTDFNLQIPANAMLFMVLCALGWISLYLERRDGDVHTRHSEREK